jgi:hypothetical protein
LKVVLAESDGITMVYGQLETARVDTYVFDKGPETKDSPWTGRNHNV